MLNTACLFFPFLVCWNWLMPQAWCWLWTHLSPPSFPLTFSLCPLPLFRSLSLSPLAFAGTWVVYGDGVLHVCECVCVCVPAPLTAVSGCFLINGDSSCSANGLSKYLLIQMLPFLSLMPEGREWRRLMYTDTHTYFSGHTHTLTYTLHIDTCAHSISPNYDTVFHVHAHIYIYIYTINIHSFLEYIQTSTY